MPRGQKSKHRAREKRRQARAEIQGLHDQATTSRGEETTSSSPPDSESAPSSLSAAGTPKGPPGAQGTTSAAAGAIRKRSGGGGTARSRSGVGAEGQVQGGENSSQASAAAESSHTDLLTMESENLVKYMLLKYKMRELIKRSEMVKVIHRRYKAQFSEILSRASEHMEMVFGLVLKEVRPNSHCYTLVSNLDLSDSESMRGDWGLPKNGLLMPLLGVIYLNGHRASEEEVWKFLNILGIYDGRMHFIFGDTRKLITENLVQEEYLEYNQVPGSNPPRYEFLWGPKALTENSKTKVLHFDKSRFARSRSGVGAEGQVQGGENSSQASAAAESSHTDLLTMESENLVKYMLLKYKMRELIKRSEMVKVIHRRYKVQFSEILSRASEHMEMVFGLVLKEVRPNSHCYTLVSNLDLSDSESMRGDWGLPKNGLLMPLLGVIYLNGHRASEEEVWKFLNILGIYDGRMHFIFGDTRKLITENLVQEEYLEYNQVPGSNPPRYEFLWGPKALTENSKTKVLQFLTKVNDLVPDALLPHYEEALREEAERTGARAATGTGPSASASADPSASARPGTSAAARAGTSASAMADMSALAGAGPLASARDGTSAAARDGTSAAARDGTSASTSAHSRATSSHSSGP
ncbi:TPA: melanoma antigen family B, 4-like [Bos taurus]|nr:TPA: melanoma antigen family B, 4-like [Bos taurus]